MSSWTPIAGSEPTTLATVTIEGQEVLLVQLHRATGNAAAPGFEPLPDMVVAVLASEYQPKPATASYYTTDHKYGTPGEMASYSCSEVGNKLASGKDQATARTGARRALQLRAAYAQYGPVAVANIQTLANGERGSLDASVAVEVGDLVAIHSHGHIRVGVAIKVTKTWVEALVATPSGGYAQGARERTADVRVWKKAQPATPAAAPVASAAEAPAEVQDAPIVQHSRVQRAAETGPDRPVGVVLELGTLRGEPWAHVTFSGLAPLWVPASGLVHAVAAPEGKELVQELRRLTPATPDAVVVAAQLALPATADELASRRNDALQRTATAGAAYNMATLRAVADLNHVDADGGRAALTQGLIEAVHPA
jgi:hypothetical protein